MATKAWTEGARRRSTSSSRSYPFAVRRIFLGPSATKSCCIKSRINDVNSPSSSHSLQAHSSNLDRTASSLCGLSTTQTASWPIFVSLFEKCSKRRSTRTLNLILGMCLERSSMASVITGLSSPPLCWSAIHVESTRRSLLSSVDTLPTAVPVRRYFPPARGELTSTPSPAFSTSAKLPQSGQDPCVMVFPLLRGQ